MNKSITNILLTGGHAATMGIAVIEEIKKKYPDANISFIGAKSAIAGTNFTTTEYKIYPTLGVKYYSINAGKLQTKFTRYTIPLILMIPVGFFQALTLLLKIKPKVILSFGGFASFPVVVWGFLLRIPVILHEQTVVYGRASKASSFFADRIALARAESLRYFDRTKSVITGNPIMSGVMKIKPKLSPSKNKVIFINVGSRGSEFIGDAIYKILPQLLKEYEIYHIAGEKNFGRYKNMINNKYHLLPYVSPLEIGNYYEMSDIIIARAGASTISELLLLKRPSIVIPLPRTFMSEQYKNADYAKEFGIATVMTESEVNEISLMTAIESTFKNWQKIVESVSERVSPDLHASEKVVELISKYIK